MEYAKEGGEKKKETETRREKKKREREQKETLSSVVRIRALQIMLGGAEWWDWRGHGSAWLYSSSRGPGVAWLLQQHMAVLVQRRAA